MRRRAAVRAVAAAALAALAVAPAAAADDLCLTAAPPPITAAPEPLRFGTTPGPAGTAGAQQSDGAPVDQGKTDGALLALRPPGRELVLRLNRLLWSDGAAGIARFGAMIDHAARLGFRVQVQVRYHPPAGHDGDLDGWAAFVRAAVADLGRRPNVVAFDVTNEANLPISPNTSDGAYASVVPAIVRGVEEARRALDALGRGDVALGFNVAWRYTPDADARFWAQLGARATPAFRAALDYVGVQLYPGLFWPPVSLPGRSAGREVVEALTLVRRCYLPRAHLGKAVALWVTENGYATNLGHTPARQAGELASTVRDLHRWSGTLGVTDYRYFNLRDNDSEGTDLFDAVGLLRDDYARKPAFALLHDLIAELGAPSPAGAPRRRCSWGGRARPCRVRVTAPARG